MKQIKNKLSAISTLPPDEVLESEIRDGLPKRIKRLSEIQDKLFAQHRFSVLLIFQGMDASGKDGAIKHIFSGVNPAGCRVKSFKVPTEEEFGHDFLWRIHKECPEKGMIQIFNRSHYEDILVPWVHKKLNQKELKARMDCINDFEKLLEASGTIVLKFYLHVSGEEQHQRIEERKRNPNKLWKYSEADGRESFLRKDYIKAYEAIFNRCSRIPWHVIPSDKNWYKNHLIIELILKKLEKYRIEYPQK